MVTSTGIKALVMEKITLKCQWGSQFENNLAKKKVNTICEERNNIWLIKRIKLLIATNQVSEIILDIAANIYVLHIHRHCLINPCNRPIR